MIHFGSVLPLEIAILEVKKPYFSRLRRAKILLFGSDLPFRNRDFGDQKTVFFAPAAREKLSVLELLTLRKLVFEVLKSQNFLAAEGGRAQFWSRDPQI